MFDFTSLLLATAISGLCLSFTMLAFRLTARSGSFMMTWSVGLLLIVSHVLAYCIYVHYPVPPLGAFVAASLPLGVAVIYAAAREFVYGTSPVRPALAICLPYLALVLPLLAAGYDGIALIVQNATVATLFIASSVIYFRHRREAPLSMSTLAALYAVVGCSFALCGLVLLLGAQWRIGHAPDNWAERLNIVVAVICMTGMGALSVSVDQARLARRHEADAMTDPLTGLLNRRALFGRYGGRKFGVGAAAIMFDLDHFKKINDIYGHAVGDDVIRRFACTLRDHVGGGDTAARTGGEEFALVMSDTTPDHARRVAERITSSFAATPVATPNGLLHCTVSAGVGFGNPKGVGFDQLLMQADKALYAAKRSGRNRVEAGGLKLAS